MKMLLTWIFSGLSLVLPAAAMAQDNRDREAVEAVMRDFVRSFETGNAELMRTTARSDGLLIGYSKSKAQVVVQSNEAWSKGFHGKPADDEAQRKRSFEVLDVTATGAVSKVMLDYPGWKGLDYIALSKIDGRWTIISKSWNGVSAAALAQAKAGAKAKTKARRGECGEVELAMRDFIRAYETGDGDFMRKVFRKDGMMIGYSASKIVAVDGEAFASRFDGTVADDEAQRKRHVDVLDVTENAALVKVTLDYPAWDGVDYLALTNIDGAWKIVSKSWSGRAKPKASQ